MEELVEAVDARSRPGGQDTRTVGGWGPSFMHCVQMLGDVWRDMPASLRRQSARDQAVWLLSRPLPEAELMGAFRERLMAGWAHGRLSITPDAFPSDGKQPGLHMSKYKHWMGLGFEGHAPPMLHSHITTPMAFGLQRKLMRFRLCCWPLEANRSHHIPREQRICRMCNKAVEDERHVLLDCEAYDEIRESYGLARSTDMRTVMREWDQVKLAKCLQDVWTRRIEKLASLMTQGVLDTPTAIISRDEEPLRLV